MKTTIVVILLSYILYRSGVPAANVRPHTERSHSQDDLFIHHKPDNDDDQESQKMPQFMETLYECWQARDDGGSVKRCLLSAGESERQKIEEIVNSNTIIGFIGKGKILNKKH